MRERLSVCVLAAPLLACAVSCDVTDGDTKKRVGAVAWEWNEDENRLLHCVSHHLTDYEVRITRAEGERPDRFRVTILDGAEEVHSFPAHDETVFTRIADVVFVAHLNPIATGCSVVAFDLKGRKELWRTWLNGNPPPWHSEYQHQVILGRDGDRVVVYGKESNGRYIELLDAGTGRIVGHKKLPPE